MELVYNKIISSHKNIYFEAIQNGSKSKRALGLLSNCGWLGSANHIKITEECVMSMEKYALVKKCLPMA